MDRIDAFIGPAKATAHGRAGARDQDRVGAFGERRRGGVASLPAIGVLERVATARAQQRQHGQLVHAQRREGVDRERLRGQDIAVVELALRGHQPGDGEQAILDPARAADPEQRFLGACGILARLGIAQREQPGRGVAIVQKRPLVDIEKRAAALGRRETAGLERQRVDARIAGRRSQPRQLFEKTVDERPVLLQRLATARGAAAIQRGCRVGADFATTTIHLEPHRGGVAELVASGAQRIDDRATRFHQARDRVEQCVVEESAVGLRLDPAEAADLDPLGAGDRRAFELAAQRRGRQRSVGICRRQKRCWRDGEHPDGRGRWVLAGGRSKSARRAPASTLAASNAHSAPRESPGPRRDSFTQPLSKQCRCPGGSGAAP